VGEGKRAVIDRKIEPHPNARLSIASSWGIKCK
jgi:hypothetical protein